MGVDDDDGVAVASRCLLPQLVGDEVAHEGGLAHARARHVEVVAAQEVVGKADRPGRGGGGVAHVGAAPVLPAEGRSTFAPERSTRGVSSAAPGGCQREATSRTPRTLRLAEEAGGAGSNSDGAGVTGLTLPARKRAPAGWS